MKHTQEHVQPAAVDMFLCESQQLKNSSFVSTQFLVFDTKFLVFDIENTSFLLTDLPLRLFFAIDFCVDLTNAPPAESHSASPAPEPVEFNRKKSAQK